MLATRSRSRYLALANWHATVAGRALHGYQVIILFNFAAATSSSDECWPSVHLRNDAESHSAQAVGTEADAPPAKVALWIRGLPCMRHGPCCSAKISLAQVRLLSFSSIIARITAHWSHRSQPISVQLVSLYRPCTSAA